MGTFSEIPIRENDIDLLIDASWWNTIRTSLIQNIGDASYFKVPDTQTLADASTISVDANAYAQLLRVQGNAAPVTLSNTPFGTGTFNNGKLYTITCLDNTNTVRLNFNDAAKGLILNGEFVVLKRWHSITFLYLEEQDRFIEINRNF